MGNERKNFNLCNSFRIAFGEKKLPRKLCNKSSYINVGDLNISRLVEKMLGPNFSLGESQTSSFRRLALDFINLQSNPTLLINVLFKNLIPTSYYLGSLYLWFSEQQGLCCVCKLRSYHVFRDQAGLCKLSRWTATW